MHQPALKRFLAWTVRSLHWLQVVLLLPFVFVWIGFYRGIWLAAERYQLTAVAIYTCAVVVIAAVYVWCSRPSSKARTALVRAMYVTAGILIGGALVHMWCWSVAYHNWPLVDYITYVLW